MTREAIGDCRKRWTRFLMGTILLGSCIAFFASGYSPPGAVGEVLRHNQQHDIDASALFYSEVENMSELEVGLAEMMSAAGRRADLGGAVPDSNTTVGQD